GWRHFDAHVSGGDVTPFGEPLSERIGIRVHVHEHRAINEGPEECDGSALFSRLLCLGVERRRHRPNSEPAEEGAPVHHSITWSARSRMDCGIISPRAFAVFMLTTSSNFVGCSTGRSAGLAPL